MDATKIFKKTNIVLLPCPFCGTSTENLLLYGSGSDSAYIQCLSCDAKGPEISLAKLDTGSNLIESVILKWNSRAAERKEMATVLSVTLDDAKITNIINDFEAWVDKTAPNLDTGKTFDGPYPKYIDKFTMALYGAFFAGVELS